MPKRLRRFTLRGLGGIAGSLLRISDFCNRAGLWVIDLRDRVLLRR